MKATLQGLSTIPYQCGVYCIRNVTDDKRYVGSSVNMRMRVYGHLSPLRRGVHSNRHLQAAWEKHGELSFCVEVLELVPSRNPEALAAAELKWMQHFEAFQRTNGYNLNHTVTGPNRFSAESREKMCVSQQRRWLVVQMTERESVRIVKRPVGWPKGKSFSPAHRANLSSARRGKPRSEETKRRISHAKSGHAVSSETRERLRLLFAGRKLTEEWREKVVRNLASHGAPKTYIVTEPNGNRHVVENLARFARLHGLKESGLYNVACGLNASYKKWKVCLFKEGNGCG